MKAVITVIGNDMVGILAKVSAECSKSNANVMDVTQSILQDLFAMIMLVDIDKLNIDFGTWSEQMRSLGKDMGLQIHVMHEDIFNSMHRI